MELDEMKKAAEILNANMQQLQQAFDAALAKIPGLERLTVVKFSVVPREVRKQYTILAAAPCPTKCRPTPTGIFCMPDCS